MVLGGPVGKNQGIGDALADAYSKLELAELMTMKAAWLFDHRKPCGPEANIAKLRAADASFEACDRAVQTLGGYGYIQEYNFGPHFRECQIMKTSPAPHVMLRIPTLRHIMQRSR